MDYALVLDRIHSILQADPYLARIITRFELGDIGQPTQVADTPLIRVVLPPSPEVSRRVVGSSPTLDRRPPYLVESEAWVIIICSAQEQWQAQKQLFGLVEHATRVLAAHARLADLQGNNPLCLYSEVVPQRRMERTTGRQQASMNLRIRYTHVDSEIIQPEAVANV